jgi:hypothetical protein
MLRKLKNIRADLPGYMLNSVYFITILQSSIKISWANFQLPPPSRKESAPYAYDMEH